MTELWVERTGNLRHYTRRSSRGAGFSWTRGRRRAVFAWQIDEDRALAACSPV